MKFLTLTLLSLVLFAIAFVAYSFYVSRPAVDTTWDVESNQLIADPALALTFARTASSLIRVTRHNGDTIEGIDITAGLGESSDLIEAYAKIGYEGLVAVAGSRVIVPLDELRVPVDFQYPYLAAGLR